MSKSCTEQNGRLELSINNEPGYREVGYELKSFVVAAFKAFISFSSFSATGTSGLMLEYRVDTNNYVSVARTGGSYTSKICIAGSLSTVTAGGADASGTIHIERTGMIVRTYYGGGAGTLISSSTEFSTDPGKMKVVLYAATTEVAAAYADDFVFQESPNSLFDSQFVLKGKGSDKISVARRGHRDYKNKITVQWTKRGYGYMAGTVDCQDLVDMDANGVMDVAMRLEGICTLTRADKMGRLFLKKNVNQCEVYAGELGPQSFGTAPGSIVYLSSKRLDMSNVPARVLAVKEGNDYSLEVEFSEEKEIYELDSYAWDNTAPIPNAQYNVSVVQAIKTMEMISIGAGRAISVSQQLKFTEVVAKQFETTSLEKDVAVTDRVGVADVQITETWSPSDKHAAITLSNVNMTAAHNATDSGFYRAVRATLGKTADKWYCEITNTTGTDVQIGILDSDGSLAQNMALDAHGYSYGSSTGKKYNNGTSYFFVGSTPYTYGNGSKIMIALDMTAGKVWFGRDGTWLGTSADPGAGTGEAFSSLAGSGTMHITYCPLTNGDTCTVNFGASQFSYAIPTGFKPLMAVIS